MANFDLSSLALKSVCPNNEIFVDEPRICRPLWCISRNLRTATC